MFKRLQSESGVTIIEVMIAGVLILIIAIAILPSFAELQGRAKLASFKVSCNAIVKAKLNEYVTGSGNISSATTGRITNGWQYTKYRLQDTAGVTTACRDPVANPSTPGFRESAISNAVLSDTAPTEANVPAELLGFQLWVNLRRYNPRVAATAQPTRDCMTAAERNGAAQDNLISVGDAVEVTVTGMIRTNPTRALGGRGGVAFAGGVGTSGGVKDINATTPNPLLTCSASQIIYPNRSPFRYFLGIDGKIRNTQSAEMIVTTGTAGTSSDAAIESHFRSLWSTDPTATGTTNSPPISGISGFAVSPNSTSVYLLRQGSMSLHTGCTKQAVVVNGITFNGAPNCAATPTAEWRINNNTIDAITVDFRDLADNDDDLVYGLLNTGPTTTNRALVMANPTFPSPPANPLVNTVDFNESTNYTLPNIPRLISIFLVSNYPLTTPPSMYIADPSCYTGPTGSASGSTFCVRVYNSSDLNLTYDMADLPIQAIAFSN